MCFHHSCVFVLITVMLADSGYVNTWFNTTRLQPRPRDKKLRRGQKIQPIRRWHVTGMVIVCAGGGGGGGEVHHHLEETGQHYHHIVYDFFTQNSWSAIAVLLFFNEEYLYGFCILFYNGFSPPELPSSSLCELARPTR
jgi:hypothetical protein